MENDKNISIARLISDIDSLNVYDSINTGKAFNRVKSKLGWNRLKILNWLRNIAAIISIPLLIGTVYLMVGNRHGASEDAQMVEFTTTPGMTARITLPDSSIVILNACSSIKYPYFFSSSERHVELRGEAFFDVSKDKDRKFTVTMANGNEVNVYGTKFNIDAYDDSKYTVSLVEGRIGYNYQDKSNSQHEHILMPQQRLTHLSDDSITIQWTDNAAETAWMDNKIILNSTPLAEILKKLERRYNVAFKIELEDVDSHSFSGGAITVSSLEVMLNALSISSSFKWSYIDDADNLQDKPVIVISEL